MNSFLFGITEDGEGEVDGQEETPELGEDADGGKRQLLTFSSYVHQEVGPHGSCPSPLSSTLILPPLSSNLFPLSTHSVSSRSSFPTTLPTLLVPASSPYNRVLTARFVRKAANL
jgi:hypothetical protein